MTLASHEITGLDTIDCDICNQHPDVIFNFTVRIRFTVDKKRTSLCSWYEVCAQCALSFVNYPPTGLIKIEKEDNI